MAFTYDTTTSRGRVRLKIGDTDTSDSTKQIFDDDEIDAFLAMENNEVLGAAAAACESLASATARSAVMYRAVRLLEIDRRQMPQHFRALAEQFRKQMNEQTPSEHIDSFDHVIGDFGGDGSEYVGDIW